MISKITILSFLAIIILNIIGFLCLLKFRLNDKNLVGIKGIVGHSGPAGYRGDVGEQADPIPCYENQENKSKMCNYFIDNREELKGAKGKDGIIGEDGIPNWDSNVLNYPDNTLKCDNVNGYRRNLKGACFKEKLISDRIRKMNRNDSRLFWNVYDDRWCRIKKQRNNETFDDWKKRSIKMLLGVNANNEDKKKLDSIFEDKRIKNENFITKDDSDNLCSIICQNNINFEGLCNCRTRKSVNFNICNKPLEKTPWCDVVKRKENERNNDWSLRIYKVMTGRNDHQTSDPGVYHNSETVLKNKEYITKWDADKLCRNACILYGKGINSGNELPGCICEDIKNKYEDGRHNDQAKNWCNSLESRESAGYKSIKNERDKNYGNIKNIRDKGYDDDYNGWYDVQGCGKKTDYCRWVGDMDGNHNPAEETFIQHGDSSRSDGSWDCVIGDDQNVKMMYGAKSTKFNYEKLDLTPINTIKYAYMGRNGKVNKDPINETGECGIANVEWDTICTKAFSSNYKYVGTESCKGGGFRAKCKKIR